MTIGDRVKLLREQKGMTQEDLAQKLGYKNKSSVTHIEKGRDIPRSMVVKLADILETTPQYLMGWDDTPTFPPQRGGLKAAKIITKKLAPDEVRNEPIAIKATKSEWTEIMNRMSDENRQKLQDYAEFLRLKQDQDGQEE